MIHYPSANIIIPRNYRKGERIERPAFPGAEELENAYAMPSGVSQVRRAIKPVSQGWTPALAGYVLFWDADRGIFQDTAGTTQATADNDHVSFLTDYSGNSRNLTGNNFGGGANLVLLNNILNGHRVISGNGSSVAQSASFTLNQAFTIFQVCKITWAASATHWSDPAGGVVLLTQSATVGDWRLFAGSGDNTGNTTGFANSTWCIVCVVWNGASTRIRVNANTSVAQNPSTGNANGYKIFAAGATRQEACGLAYATALSTSDEAIVRNDINTRFAIF